MTKLKLLKTLFINIGLLLVALIISTPLLIWGVIEFIIYSVYNRRLDTAIKMVGEFILMIAILIDVAGNVLCAVPFNRLLKVKRGYKFGNRHDTISYVLGVNLLSETLTPLGKMLADILDAIDDNHCIKTVENRRKDGTI